MRAIFIKEVLKILNTITEDDYFTSLDEYFSARDRSELVKDYFVEKPYSMTGTNSPSSSSLFGDYFCTTEVTNIELDLRETSDDNQVVCYYSFTMTSSFIDVDAPPFTNVITGEMTLEKLDETYKIGHINTRSYDYAMGFLEHVEMHEIDISEDSYSEYLKSLLAQKIFTGAETYQLSNQDDNSIVVFENNMIKLGYKGGEFIQSFTYKELDYDLFEDSIVFYIIEEVEVFGDGNYSLSQVDYQDKLIINENEITYYHKYQSDNMIESHWPYVFEGTYYLMSDEEGILPSLTISDDEFTLSFDPLSSYFNTGTYSISANKLLLETDDGKHHYTFEIDDYELTFLMDESSSVTPISEMGPSIVDKSRFSHLK